MEQRIRKTPAHKFPITSGGLDLCGSLARKWYREQLVDMVRFGEVASPRCSASDPLSKG